MDSKLIELSNLLCTIQDMQEKTEQQLDDMKQDYFAYPDLKEQAHLYNRAKINCGIAYDYMYNINEAIEEAQNILESLIDESAQSQKGGVA